MWRKHLRTGGSGRTDAARYRDNAYPGHPGAADSLREGMEETLTVIRLKITGKLRRTLESTGACESMIDTVRRTQRNVKHWTSGEMGMRWTAAGMREAEQQFRKVIGYTQRSQLAVTIEHQLHLQTAQPHPDPGGRHRSHRVKITPGPPSRTSTTNGTTSRPGRSGKQGG